MSENQSVTIKDDGGRSLELRRLSMLEEMDLLEAAEQASEVRRWMMMATMCAVVRGIDDVPCAFPRTKEQIRAHVQKVGAAGFNAVSNWLAAEVEAAGGLDGALPGDLSEDAAKN